MIPVQNCASEGAELWWSLSAEVTERIELLCRLGEDVGSVQILFEAQCLGLISEEL